MITPANISSWLLESHTIRDPNAQDDAEANKNHAAGMQPVQPGDVVWISKRRDPPEVRSSLDFG